MFVSQSVCPRFKVGKINLPSKTIAKMLKVYKRIVGNTAAETTNWCTG